jgi:hypothetical protein
VNETQKWAVREINALIGENCVIAGISSMVALIMGLVAWLTWENEAAEVLVLGAIIFLLVAALYGGQAYGFARKLRKAQEEWE